MRTLNGQTQKGRPESNILVWYWVFSSHDVRLVYNVYNFEIVETPWLERAAPRTQSCNRAHSLRFRSFRPRLKCNQRTAQRTAIILQDPFLTNGTDQLIVLII